MPTYRMIFYGSMAYSSQLYCYYTLYCSKEMNEVEMIMNDTGVTNATCPAKGEEKWWIFLVVSILIYIIGLSISSILFLLRWLVVVKFQLVVVETNTISDVMNTKRQSYYKIFHDYIRQLMQGDSISSRVIITLIMLCNLVYIGIGIYRSYVPNSVEECFTLSESPEKILELVVVIVLTIFSFLRLLASDNIIFYWFNIYSVVDVFTLPHIFVSIALGVDWIGLRSLRFVWLTQVTTVLRFAPFIHSQDAVDLISLFIYFLVLWLTSSGIIHLVETQGDPWRGFSNRADNPVLVYAYFIMVTISTVGYGDIAPKTDLGRILMTFFIIGGLAFFAAILPELIEVISNYYAKIQFARFDMTLVPRHVIVCGHITAVTAEDFLKDFLHTDRGDYQTHVLFLHKERPDNDLKNVLRSYYTRVQYLVGSVLNSHDLKKARIFKSSAVFILANKHTNAPSEEDHANLLRVVSVKNTTKEIPIIIQLLHSFSKKQVINIEGWEDGRDIALCLSELKLGLLAQSCLCPGFSTLIANLFSVSTSITAGDAWKEHYIRGAANEVYSSPFSESFEGKTFHEAAYICYNELNLVLLALECIGPGYHKYYVNPSPLNTPDLKIVPSSMLGYFIGQDQRHVSAVSTYCDCCPGSKHISGREAVMNIPLISHLRKNIGKSELDVPMEDMHEVPCVVKLDVNDTTLAEEIGTSSLNKSEETLSKKKLLRKKTSIYLTVPDKTKHTWRRSVQSSYDLSSSEDEEGEMFQLYVCKPNRLEASLLNPDMSANDKSFRPQGNIKDHIVLCIFADSNSPLLGLHNFLTPLRGTHFQFDNIKPVVIVSEKHFIEKEWKIIRNIPKVYLVIGSPLRWANLRAANVTECSVCVILSVLATTSSHEQAIDDKEVILCSLSLRKKLKRAKKRVQIITDLRQESNVQFLDFGDEDEPDERIYKAQPFACGEAFSISMFDSITSSAFHGPGTLYLVEDLIHASGTRAQCQVILIPISDTNYTGTIFREFYNDQLQKYSNICLALSRKLSSNDGQSSLQRYVITSPDPGMILDQGDVAFVITE